MAKTSHIADLVSNPNAEACDYMQAEDVCHVFLGGR